MREARRLAAPPCMRLTGGSRPVLEYGSRISDRTLDLGAQITRICALRGCRIKSQAAAQIAALRGRPRRVDYAPRSVSDARLGKGAALGAPVMAGLAARVGLRSVWPRPPVSGTRRLRRTWRGERPYFDRWLGC